MIPDIGTIIAVYVMFRLVETLITSQSITLKILTLPVGFVTGVAWFDLVMKSAST